jgi:hypothetical protein
MVERVKVLVPRSEVGDLLPLRTAGAFSNTSKAMDHSYALHGSSSSNVEPENNSSSTILTNGAKIVLFTMHFTYRRLYIFHT